MNKITVTTQNDTRILSITVKDEDPYVASQMADAIRVAASDHIQKERKAVWDGSLIS